MSNRKNAQVLVKTVMDAFGCHDVSDTQVALAKELVEISLNGMYGECEECQKKK